MFEVDSYNRGCHNDIPTRKGILVDLSDLFYSSRVHLGVHVLIEDELDMLEKQQMTKIDIHIAKQVLIRALSLL